MKRANQILNIIISAFVGVFAGHGAYVNLDHRKRPELYAMQSAPWYTSILAYGIVMLAAVTAAVILKVIIRRKRK